MGFIFQATVILAIAACAVIVVVAVVVSGICGAIAGVINHYRKE